MEEDGVPVENEAGDTAEMQITAVSSGEIESILTVLTSIFLILATGIIALKLHITYGFFKDPNTLKKEEAKLYKIETKP